MPSYTYHCTACDEDLDMTHKITETPDVRCPRCDDNMKRRLYPVGLDFSKGGSGFYANDYGPVKCKWGEVT
jgi:putative FmdB family regulatory protein